MNVDHLRKQAKNLQAIYPMLVAAHGATLSLSHAQDAVARTHGFPSWAAALKRAAPAAVRSTSAAAAAIRNGYVFVAEEQKRLAVAFDDVTGDPKRYSLGREVVLRYRRDRARFAVEREAHALDELSEELGDLTGSYHDYAPQDLEKLATAARAAVARSPLYLDGWNLIAGILLTQGQFAEGLAVAEPVTTALLDLLPTDGRIQVCYGLLVNRPFFRLAHCYLLLLHKADRHRDADALAKRMYALWPNDNMGFRFLLTRAARNRSM